MTTLFDILLDVYDDLGELRSGLATGGSATTLLDTALKPYSTDAFKYGTIFVTDTTDDAAPKGEFAEVTSFTPASGTLTVASGALSAAPAADDRYALADNSYPLDDMIRIVNRALRKMGPFPANDESLTTESGKTEYALPAGVRADEIRFVYYEQNTSDADNSRWTPLETWYPVPGATYELVFRVQPPTGKTLRIVHMAHHDQVNASSDTINSIIDQDWLVTEALYRALKWKARSDDTDEMRAWINDAAAEVEMARRKHRLLDPGFQFKPILTPDDTPRSQYGPRYP